MTPNVPEFKWSRQREEAALLAADDRLSNDEIAAKVGISSKQFERWKTHPTFAARIEQHLEIWRQRILKRGLAIKEKRIESYVEDFDRTTVILEERGAQYAHVPGGRTGYILEDRKGKDGDVPVYAFDAPLFRERVKIREQIADELGQLVKRTEVTGKDGGALALDAKVNVAGTELLISRIAGVAARLGAGSGDQKSE